MNFYLGTHQPQWLADERCEGVPLFVSRRTIGQRKTLPAATTDFALDSGGFTELQMHGRWTVSTDDYAVEVQRFRRVYGARLQWAAPQDWMCEPIVIAGGAAARGVKFAGTGLSVEEHQRRTVANFVDLRRALGEIVIPVLQGWTITDYWRCEDMYRAAGVDLAQEPTVGIGSVCRRQNTGEATRILASLVPLRIHGFGFKKEGIARAHPLLVSADSMAWSDTARRGVLLPGHDAPGDGRRLGHKNCANCLDYALQWRRELLAVLGPAPAVQIELRPPRAPMATA